jgi:hypothetical protein
MVNRSTLDPGNLSEQTERRSFQDTRSIGPSDSSDSGSDLAGMDITDDEQNAGERLALGRESDVHIGSDIGLDRIVGPEDAGLGGGLDQAEEARLGITDEELAELARTRSPRK